MNRVHVAAEKSIKDVADNKKGNKKDLRLLMKFKDTVYSIISGVLLIFSFPNFFDLSLNGWPGYVAWISLIPLFLALHNKDFKASFILGFICGFIYFTGTLYWITLIKELGPLSYPVWAILSIYLGLYIGMFCLFLSFTNLLYAPFLWISFEYLRGNLLSGFPWALIGYSQFKNNLLIQIASITGVYGVSFLIVFINTAIAYFFLNLSKGSRTFLVITIAVIMVIICYIYGGITLAGYLAKDEYEKNVKIAENITKKINISVIQGNIEQEIKWSKENVDNTFKIYEGLTRKAAKGLPELIVWPETAVTVYLRYEKPYLDRVLNLSKECNSDLLIGTPDALVSEKMEIKESYNSAFFISKDSKLIDTYTKMHLVPFGEFVPYESLFKFFEKWTVGFNKLTAGKNWTVFNGTDKFSVLICYEIIFPEISREFVNRNANFLVAISNDAWYRMSACPYQHFMVLPFRAVENRVNIVRSANTGISGFVDYKGNILAYIDIFQRGKLAYPIVMRHEKTIYRQLGDWFAKGCIVLSAFGVLFVRRYTD